MTATLDSSPRAPVDPLLGRVIDGRYRIEKQLGEGGMGIVYKAVHTALDKPLAIKVLRQEVSKNEEILQRFRQEARSASQIGHPHIVDISDFGTLSDGATYFVMEFLPGQSLTAALIASGGKLDVKRIVHIAQQLADALGAAHAIGIVHRDLKPDNVQLIERGGDKEFVKVLDFGIAKVGGSTSKLTKAGQVFGTPHYMSPEQCAGTPVDARTDIYAVGVILYEMCCGVVPFDAENLMGILTKHMYEAPVPPNQRQPPADVPLALEAVIMKCLQKERAARFQSMAELSAELTVIEHSGSQRSVVGATSPVPARVFGGSGSGPHTLRGVEKLDDEPEETTLRKITRPRRRLGWALALLAVLGAGVFFVMQPQPHIVQLGAAVGTSSAPAPQTPTLATSTTPSPNAATPPVGVQEHRQAQDQERRADETATQVAGSSAEPAVANAPTPTSATTTPEPAPQISTLTVTSEPARASVFAHDMLVGRTPFVLAKPSATEPVSLSLRAAGYHNKAVLITEHSDDMKVTLDPIVRIRRRRAVQQEAAPTDTGAGAGTEAGSEESRPADPLVPPADPPEPESPRPAPAAPLSTTAPPPVPPVPSRQIPPQSEVLDPWR